MIYPAMRYHVNLELAPIIVHSVEQDRALGAGWDDPYGLRSEALAEEPVKNKGGRPRKVQE